MGRGRNSSSTVDPTSKAPGFNLLRGLWTTLNRMRTEWGKCNYLRHTQVGNGGIPLFCSCG